MPTYVTPARALYDRLSASLPLAAVLTGGVFDRPLERKGPKATPTAFSPVPPFRQRPAVVVPDEGEEGDPAGPRGAFNGFPTVWFYADDDPNGVGRAAIETAVVLTRASLDGWSFMTSTGTGVDVTVIGRLGVRPDPTDEGRLIDYVRLQADGLWIGVD